MQALFPPFRRLMTIYERHQIQSIASDSKKDSYKIPWNPEEFYYFRFVLEAVIPAIFPMSCKNFWKSSPIR